VDQHCASIIGKASVKFMPARSVLSMTRSFMGIEIFQAKSSKFSPGQF
jgi:hypothetical protein